WNIRVPSPTICVVEADAFVALPERRTEPMTHMRWRSPNRGSRLIRSSGNDNRSGATSFIDFVAFSAANRFPLRRKMLYARYPITAGDGARPPAPAALPASRPVRRQAGAPRAEA